MTGHIHNNVWSLLEDANIPLEDATVNATVTWRPYDTPESLRLFFLLLILCLSAFGTVANLVNMVTFWKLRGAEPINLNLFGLALSDCLVCVTTLALFLGTAYWYTDELFLQHRIVPVEVVYLVVGIPHGVCVKITVLLTAFVSLQRCLGVVKPLKVKSIVTFSRVNAVVVFSFVAPPVVTMPGLYYLNRLEWVTTPGLNFTILRQVMAKDFHSVNGWVSSINSAVFFVLPFIVVTVCSAIMIKHLKQTMSWRLLNANLNTHLLRVVRTDPTKILQPLPLSHHHHHHHQQRHRLPPLQSLTPSKTAIPLKEKRIVKLVLILSGMFLICYIPNIITAAFVAFTYHFNLHKNDEGQEMAMYSSYFLDIVNSSFNVFVYFRHSSNYKKAFLSLFCRKKRCRVSLL